MLREPERLRRKVSELAARITEERQSLLPGGINYEMDRVQGGGHGDRYAAVMDRITMLEQEALQAAAWHDWMKYTRIPALIDQIRDENAEEVIRRFFIGGQTMDEICQDMSVSRSSAYNYRRMGIARIQNALDKEDKCKSREGTSTGSMEP